MAIRPGAIVANLRRVLLVIGVSALCGVLFAGLALPVVASLGLGAREGADAFADMPAELETQPLAQRSRVVDEAGNTLATFYAENRVYVGLDKIAPVMKDAILAIEDDRFYNRGPLDIQGTLRALLRNVESGETQGGGSTLTQQYVKLVRLSQATTPEEKQDVLASSGVEGYRRKLEELRMAVGIEQKFTKDEILERYLNIAYFGAGAHGIEAASRTYFSTTAAELTLTQAATLAGLVQSPTEYDPTRNPEAALARRDTVLNRMAEVDPAKITDAQAAEARGTELGLQPSPTPNGCTSAWAGYFCDYLVHEIRTMPELGETPNEREQTLLRGGLTIVATIDKKTQDAAQNAVSGRVAPTDDAIGTLASVEPVNGYIRAMANSRQYGVEGDGVSNINYAVDWNMGGGRGIQPGSSMKPFVLAAAIKQGIGLNTTINSPQVIDMSGKKFKTCSGNASDPNWHPKNSTGSGRMNLRTGTEKSVNTFYIQLSQRTGLCEPARIAEAAGVHRAYAGMPDEDGEPYPAELQQVPSFSLGVNEVSPLAMAQGYAMFANRGVHCPATSVVSITDANGEVIVDHSKPKCERVLDAKVADTVNSVLQGVIHNSGGTGSPMRLADGRVAGGKTGTRNDSISVWFVGYVPQLATAVAVADVDGELTTLDGRRFNGERVGTAFGSTLPGPIWEKMMNAALEGEPKQSFHKPDNNTVRGASAAVPDVRGMNADQAIDRLSGEGFSASVAGEVASDLAEGVVVHTDPAAGQTVSAGSYVGVYVSAGMQVGGEWGTGNEDGGDGPVLPEPPDGGTDTGRQDDGTDPPTNGDDPPVGDPDGDGWLG